MYVTRPLSLYKRNPEALSSPPPEGPNSGILVILDKEAESTFFFGLLKDRDLSNLPFPQNKNLTIRYSTSTNNGNNYHYYDVILVPVVNQPLSSNLYYAIKPDGRRKGEAYTSSKEEDMAICCFCRCINDVKPKPLDPSDPYQQFEISRLEGWFNSFGGFTAKSVAPGGFPPYFLRRKGWEIYAKTPKRFQLGEAMGLDTSLRSRLPDINFSVSTKASEPVVVGKWYCPFMFVKDGNLTLKEQVKRTPYYEMTLEQKWERIFSFENEPKREDKPNSVNVDVLVQKEAVFVAGKEVSAGDRANFNGVMWFRGSGYEGTNVGLSMKIIERMEWEQQRFGWEGGNGKEKEERVKKVEEFEGVGEWRNFGCYVLVESFVLKRMGGSLVLNYDFKHTHHIRSKWE